MSRLQFALDRISFARNYTRRFLHDFPLEQWFHMPAEGVTHVAWQVGHIAYAQYRLTLLRFRGAAPIDAELMPEAFQAAFRPQSIDPSPDPSRYPSAESIRATLDHVHAAVMAELPGFPDADLDSPITPTHDIATSKIEVLHWCADHELVHAGQIALLRRLCGHKPIW